MQTIPRSSLEAVREAWEETVEYGASIRVTYWPTIQIGRSLFSPKPAANGRALEATVVQPDGLVDPYIAGEVPLGEVSLSPQELEAIPGAVEFMAALDQALKGKLAAQQPPPPPEPIVA